MKRKNSVCVCCVSFSPREWRAIIYRHVPAAAGKLEQRSDDVCTSVIFSVCAARMREIERETLFRLNNNWLMTRPRAFSHSVGISARAEAERELERQNVSLREPMDTKNIFIYIHEHNSCVVVRDNLSRERSAINACGVTSKNALAPLFEKEKCPNSSVCVERLREKCVEFMGDKLFLVWSFTLSTDFMCVICCANVFVGVIPSMC